MVKFGHMKKGTDSQTEAEVGRLRISLEIDEDKNVWTLEISGTGATREEAMEIAHSAARCMFPDLNVLSCLRRLGEIVVSERKRQGLTQSDLGSRADLSQYMVESLERGSGSVKSYITALEALERGRHGGV